MYIKSKKLACTFIIITLLLSLINMAYADGGSGSISHVVIKIGDDMVVITSEEYSSALTAGSGNPVYNYLADGDIPFVRAIRSGDKFIAIGLFGLEMAEIQEVSAAITSAPAQSQDIVKEYQVFRGFDSSQNPVLTPLFPVVNYSAIGENGTLTAKVKEVTINSGNEVIESSTVVFTASPADGYKVKEWKKDGNVIVGATDNTYTITDIQNNTTVNVEFEEVLETEHTVEFGVTGSNGSLTAKVGDIGISTGDSVAEGSTVVFTATPASGYRVKEWKKNNAVIVGAADNTYTVTNLQNDIDVYVIFEEIPIVTSALVNELYREGAFTEYNNIQYRGIRSLELEGVYNVELDMGKVNDKLGNISGYNLQLTINGIPVMGEGEVIGNTFVIKTEYAVLPSIQGGNYNSEITINPEALASATVVKVSVDPLSAPVSELYKDGIGEYYDSTICHGVNKVVPGVYNIELGMSKVIARFGDISNKELQLKIDGIVIKGQNKHENIIDTFVVDSDNIYLPAIQQGHQVESVTINPATLAGGTVYIVQ